MWKKLLSPLPSFFRAPWLSVVLYGLVFSVLAISLAEYGGVTNDSWWHLKTGQELWEGTFSFYDSYSWTAPGAFWPAHELAFEWLLYGLWLLGGESFFLMMLLNTALVMGSLLLLIPPRRVRELYGARFNILVPILLFLTGFSLLGFVQIRAQAISFLFFALTVRLTLSKKPQWLPLVFLGWVWLHGSVSIGVALLGIATLIFIGRWLFDRNSKEKRKDAFVFSLSGIGALLATCLSPLGFGYWSYFVTTLSYGDTQIGEWLSLTEDPVLIGYAVVSVVLLSIAMAILWQHRRRWEVLYLLGMSLFFLLYSFNALRVFSNLSLMSLPLLLLAVMVIPVKDKPTTTDDKRYLTASIVFTAVIVAVSIFFTGTMTTAVLESGSRNPFLKGGVAEAISSEECKDSLWNDYDTGSYLIWFMEDIPVSVDSRFDLYPSWVLAAVGVVVPPEGTTDPTELLNEVIETHDVSCFVMSNSIDSAALEARGLPVIAKNQDMIVFRIPEDGIPERS